jgi:hypothetical protein
MISFQSPDRSSRMLRWVNRVLEVPLAHPRLRQSLYAADNLLELAEKRTGLSDWGEFSFLLPLRMLLESLETEAHLTPLGSAYILFRLLGDRLANRLFIQREFTERPALSALPILRPVIITGLPRTGTTFLHRLLANIQGVRTLQRWELNCPAPPPHPATYATDPRRRRSFWLRLLATGFWGLPALTRINAIHPSETNQPEECSHLFLNSFKSRIFGLFGRVPGYSTWVRKQEMLDVLAYHKQQLQLLLLNYPGYRPVLKAPGYLGQLGALFRIYPDAQVIHTHRDVNRVVPSTCSFISTMRRLYSDRVSSCEVGQEVLEEFLDTARRALEFRQSNPDAPILDIYYHELIRDPLGTARRICSVVGLELLPEDHQRLQSWLQACPPVLNSAHRYSLETCQLSSKQVLDTLGFYQEHFQVPAER